MTKHLTRGERLRAELKAALDFDVHEEALLDEAARLCERLDALDSAIRQHGPLLPDGRPHPALAEARQQAITFARVLSALRLPADLANPEERPQRRHGARGVYTNHKLRVIG